MQLSNSQHNTMQYNTQQQTPDLNSITAQWYHRSTQIDTAKRILTRQCLLLQFTVVSTRPQTQHHTTGSNYHQFNSSNRYCHFSRSDQVTSTTRLSLENLLPVPTLRLWFSEQLVLIVIVVCLYRICVIQLHGFSSPLCGKIAGQLPFLSLQPYLASMCICCFQFAYTNLITVIVGICYQPPTASAT